MISDDALIQAALRRAQSRLGAVRFAGTSTGGYDVYHVGSSQDPDTGYRVTVSPAGEFKCTCPSELRPACWHRGSVWLVRAQRMAGGLPAAGPTVAEMARKETAERRLSAIRTLFA